MSLLALFCEVDDFYIEFERYLEKHRIGRARGKRGPKPALSLSEVMTIIIHFHQSNYRNFKAYYTEHVAVNLRSEVPNLVSYNRVVELMPGALLPLCAYLGTCLAAPTGIAFIDSTPLTVCHNRRIERH